MSTQRGGKPRGLTWPTSPTQSPDEAGSCQPAGTQSLVRGEHDSSRNRGTKPRSRHSLPLAGAWQPCASTPQKGDQDGRSTELPSRPPVPREGTPVPGAEAWLPCTGQGQKRGTEPGCPENGRLPRPTPGNFLFPNTQEIKIGRQEGQTMFAKT